MKMEKTVVSSIPPTNHLIPLHGSSTNKVQAKSILIPPDVFIRVNKPVSVLCDNTQHLEYINDALRRCADAGFDLSGLKVCSSKKTDSLLHKTSNYGTYRPDLKAVIFRHNVDWRTLAQESQIRFPEWAEKTYFGSPSHLALHEFGHYLHHQHTQSQFSEIAKTKIDKETKQRILAEMGHTYPTRNAGEAVAEMFAGLMSGKKYSPELLKFYQKCRGPIPPRF
jgi:hypothetical protein